MAMFDDKIGYAKTLVNKKFKCDDTCYRDSLILGRYMLYLGNTEKEVEEEITKRFEVTIPLYGKIDNQKLLNRALNAIKAGGPLKPNPPISFSKKELDFIRSCGDLTQQKALFIICCAWKCNNYEEVTFKQKHLFDEAKIKWNSRLYDSTMYHLIGKHHYVESRVYKSKLLYQPCQKLRDMNGFGEQVLKIDNYKNIVYYYLEYFGEGQYIRCADCGSIDKKTANAKKLCDECAKQRKLSSTNQSKKNAKSQVEEK